MFYSVYYTSIIIIYCLLGLKFLAYVYPFPNHVYFLKLLEIMLVFFKFLVGFFIVFKYNEFRQNVFRLTVQDQKVIYTCGFLLLTVAVESIQNVEQDFIYIL